MYTNLFCDACFLKSCSMFDGRLLYKYIYYIWIGEIMTFLNNVNKNQFLYYWSQCKCSYNTIVWYELMLSCVIPIGTLAEAKRGWRRVHCPHLLSLLTRLSFATCGEGCFEAEAASVWSKNKFTFICIMTNYIPTYLPISRIGKFKFYSCQNISSSCSIVFSL